MTKEFSIASCRVSSPEQEENNSLTRQYENVLKAAEELNAPIIKKWSGSVSSKRGTNIDRPDIKQMIEFCKKNRQVKYLIVDEPDRFMRSVDEGIYFEVVFKQLGVKVWYASDPILNGENLSAKLLKFSKYFSAEGSNDERIFKSVSGQSTALRSGRYPFHPKAGYKKGVINGIPEIHPVRGTALQDVLIRIAEHTVSPTEGLKELNNSNYTQERKPLKMDKFRKIATDPFYAGIVEINRQVKVRNENGAHCPLITIEQHNELLRIFDNKKKNQSGPRKNGNPKYPLNSITCHDTCLDSLNKGKFVGYDHGNGKNPNLVYEKYRCRSCGFYLSRDELHSKVTQQFDNNPITKEGTKDFIEALDIVWKRKEAQAKQDSIRIGQRITALDEKINKCAMDAIDPSNISIKTEILVNIENMKIEVIEKKEELSILDQKAETDKDNFLKFAFDFVNNMGKNFLSISPENRIRCKQIIFPAGFCMDAEKNVYTPEISPLIRLVSNIKDLPESEKSSMVRSLDNRWNHILPSLYLMQSKLANLGVVLVNDEVVYYSSQEDYNALV
jgi:DNA invertase Pin-like site-specific DNA recombinase